VVVALGMSACGGQDEVARTPTAAKVAWSNADGEPEPASEEEAEVDAKVAEPAESAAVDGEMGQPGDIDLDAPPTKPTAKAAPKREPKAKPKPKSAPKPEPEPAAAAEEVEKKAAAEPAPAEPAPEPPATDPLARELQKRRAALKARSDAEARAEAKGKKPSPKKPAASAAEATPTYTGPDPCQATSFSLPRVREACANGGRAGAKRVMKDAIGKATATGQSLKCADCHSNLNDYTLKGDAVAELKRWLGS
jgi:outer membrane biosynthesis protein TonB